MLFLIYTKEKKYLKKESGYMLNEEICQLREKLNESIINGEDYSVTYKLSVELDELIAKYYQKETKRKKRNKKDYLTTK